MALRASARGANEGGYEFAQPPRVAGGGLFRDPAQPKAVTNIMYDNRVVRGNTYAAPVVPPVSLYEGCTSTSNGSVQLSHVS